MQIVSAADGYDLALVDRDKARKKALAAPHAYQTGVAAGIRDERRIELVVNNAGASPTGAFVESGERPARRLFPPRSGLKPKLSCALPSSTDLNIGRSN